MFARIQTASLALAMAGSAPATLFAQPTVIGINLLSETWGYNCTSITVTPDPQHPDTGTIVGNCYEKNGDDAAMAHIFHSGFDGGPRGGWAIHVHAVAPLMTDDLWLFCHFAYDNGSVVMLGCPSDAWGA